MSGAIKAPCLPLSPKTKREGESGNNYWEVAVEDITRQQCGASQKTTSFPNASQQSSSRLRFVHMSHVKVSPRRVSSRGIGLESPRGRILVIAPVNRSS